MNIFIDGSCLNNPGPGGWGAYVEENGKTRTLSGKADHTTNNRMELTAAIKALELSPPGAVLTVNTDSTYVLMGITSWITKWRKSSEWKDPNSGKIKNKDLWYRLDELNQSRKVIWKKVKAHSNIHGNEMAHQLAFNAANNQRDKVK